MTHAFRFQSKALTLEELAPRIRTAKVADIFHFEVAEWRSARESVLARLAEGNWLSRPLVVRSSAALEDQAGASLAGHFLSVIGVQGKSEVVDAIERVIASYGESGGEGDRVLLQPRLCDVAVAGVAFGRDPATGGPYYVIGYDESGSTTTVTSGRAARTYFHAHASPFPAEGPLDRVVDMMRELVAVTGTDHLDVEFAITKESDLYLLQARPLAFVRSTALSDAEHASHLALVARAVRNANRPHPYLHGARTLFGVMPDWNPAEMIGIRPRPLSLSLYREMITDVVWAYQRDNYGYKRLRSFPLMTSFHGLPYIDVRVSFTSFIPKSIDGHLADRLVNHYLTRLAEAPSLHDKVEFEIIFSCYTLDLPDRIASLSECGFSGAEIERLVEALRILTRRVIGADSGQWRGDLARIAELEIRREQIVCSDLDLPQKIYWLLEDCKRYGTLPFAGLARAGFIAVQLLGSFVSVGVLTRAEYDSFLQSLDTVSSSMKRDVITLSREAFLQRYGHLRPGTYDVRSPRYDEAPDRYFDWNNRPVEPSGRLPVPFSLSLDKYRELKTLLVEHGLGDDPLVLFDFIKIGIEGRERSKFIFSRSLSDALALLCKLGLSLGFSVDDLTYMDIGCVRELYVSSHDWKTTIAHSIAAGRARYELTQSIALPPLIADERDVWTFRVPQGEPNFVTQRECVGEIAFGSHEDVNLDGKIVLIESADPGFDWVFTRGIIGFVTAYGGVNSHMAIRAGELGIPAVVGAGEELYRRLARGKVLRIDCANRKVEVVR